MDDAKLKNTCMRARSKVLYNFPQFAPLILGLPYRIVKGLDTAFVTKDGVVGMGDKYIEKYEYSDVGGCFMHEGMHILLDHFGRRGNRDPKMWNIAGDIVINETLRRMIANVVKDGSVRTDKDMLYPETYGFDWAGRGTIPTVQAVYDAIKSGRNKPQNGRGRDPNCGTGAGGEANPFEGEVEGVQGMSAGDADKFKKKLEYAAEAIASSCKQIGIGSAEMEMWANACIKKPKYDAMKDLRAMVSRTLASNKGRWVEPSWHKINRRGFDYLPGRQHYAPEVVVIIDTSGSMFTGEDGDNVLTELSGILLKMGKVRVITGDTKVTFDGPVTSIDEFKKRAKGGGGTELTPCFEAIGKENKAAVVCLTDGGLNCPAVDRSIVDNTVWLITSKYGSKLDFMKKCVILAKNDTYA